MNMNRTAFLVLGALLVSACSADPRIPAPALPQADAYTPNGELVSVNARIALGEHIASDWWALFSSEPLDHLIREAINGNYDLAAARATLAAANEAVEASQGRLLPQASLGAAAGRQKYGVALFGPANISIPPFTYYEAGPSVSWTPDIFGGQRHAVELQKALAEYQLHEFDATYLALTGNVVAASLEIASTTAEIAKINALLDADQEIVKLAEAAYGIGSASKTDVLDARARWLSDRNLLPPVRQRLAAARHQLAILEGKAPSGWTPPALDMKDFSLPRTLPVALPSALIRQRPDILAAEGNLHAAAAALGIATANLYPSITLTANMLQEALNPAGLFQGTAGAWSLAAGISAPVFSGGTLSAEKREARHAYEAALADYRQAILSAFGEAADALTALDADDESVSVRQDAVATARAASELVQTSYKEGAAGRPQVNDSRRTLLAAELDLVRAQHQRQADCARLLLALGGSPFATGAAQETGGQPAPFPSIAQGAPTRAQSPHGY